MRPLYAATETLILPSWSQGTVSEGAGLAPVQDWCHDCTAQSISIVRYKKKRKKDRKQNGGDGSNSIQMFFSPFFSLNSNGIVYSWCSWRNVLQISPVQLRFCFIFKYILQHSPTQSTAFPKESHTHLHDQTEPRTNCGASCSSHKVASAPWIVNCNLCSSPRFTS